jgi:hypothetical protein
MEAAFLVEGIACPTLGKDMVLIFLFLVVMGFELRPLWFLGKCSAI